MTQQPSYDDIIEAIDTDIWWHEQNPEGAPSDEYRKGFINGLIQAKYIVGEVKRAFGDGPSSDDVVVREEEC